MSSATFASQTSVGEIGTVDERQIARQRLLLGLPDAALLGEIGRILRYELDLPADERRRAVIGRLRAWLAMDVKDARHIANAFDVALSHLEPADRHTIRETEEDAIMDGLSYREFERLTGFMPSLQHWQDSVWTELNHAAVSGVPNSLAAALAMAGQTGEP